MRVSRFKSKQARFSLAQAAEVLPVALLGVAVDSSEARTELELKHHSFSIEAVLENHFPNSSRRRRGLHQPRAYLRPFLRRFPW